MDFSEKTIRTKMVRKICYITKTFPTGVLMNKNPAVALMQIETALNHLQNTMVDEDGKLTWDDTFFKLFDELMQKLNETREIAQTLRERSK